MYCKNCGRQLKEGARFCDRCGQSVRQNSQPSERETKRREIESLKEERLNRKKRIAYKEEREIRKKQKRKSHKKANFVLIFIFLIMILALISAIVSYHMNVSDSETPLGGMAVETASPASQMPAATANIITTTERPSGNDKDKQDENTNTEIDGAYESFTVNNITCPYPRGFASKALSGNERLSLTDSVGGAAITISVEDNITAPTTDLMRDYASQTGGQIIDSRAGSTGFSVTAKRDNIIYHRKCVVDGSSIVYYDFQYSTGSSKASQYEENIAYMDSVMSGADSE